MSQHPARAPVTTSDRIWTIPNAISFIRLLGVPLFLYLLLGPHNDVAAVVVLAIGGTTDWVDGYVARRLGQVSRLGELLDPFADRLYILATLVGFTVREVIPWWLTAALLLRELVLGVALLVLRRHGYGPPPVHYLGKTGTFVLLTAFPVLLLAYAVPSTEPVAGPIGWGLAWWAVGLYWAAAVLYLTQAAAMLRGDAASARKGPGRTAPLAAAPATAPSDPTRAGSPTTETPSADLSGAPARPVPPTPGAPATDRPATDAPATDRPVVERPPSGGAGVDGAAGGASAVAG